MVLMMTLIIQHGMLSILEYILHLPGLGECLQKAFCAVTHSLCVISKAAGDVWCDTVDQACIFFLLSFMKKKPGHMHN